MEPTRLILLGVLLFAFASTEIAAQDEDGAFLTVVPKDEERHIQSHTVRLTCVAYGVPFPNVTWTRLPNTVLTSNIVTNTSTVNGTTEGGLVTSTLTLCDVQQTVSGLYRCEASNGVTASPPPEDSITEKNFSLIIIPMEIPRLVLFSPDKISAENSTTIRLVCSATGVPNPTFNWTVDRASVPMPSSEPLTEYTNTTSMNGTEIVTSVIEICSARVGDSGRYTCIASNERGNDSMAIDLTLTVPPSFDQPTSDQSVEVFRGDTTTLTCSGRGYPQANVTWLRNGVALTNNSKYSIVVTFVGNELRFDSSITINSLVKVDEGNYTCQAQIGDLNSTAEIFRVTVIIPVAPTIILRPPYNVTIRANETVRLTCSATGVPTPNVTWFNSTDDQLMNDTNIRVFNKQEIVNGTTIVTSVLQLCSTRIADAGVYRCETGNDSITVDVLVQVPVQVTNSSLQNVEKEESENATLVCAVSGHPLPTVTWMRNSTLLSTDMKYMIVNTTGPMDSQIPGLMGVTSRLTIINLNLEDTENYTCHAKNENSSEEVRYSLTVTSPARIINSLPKNISIAAGSNVTLECTGAGVPIPTVEWSNSDGPVSNDSYQMVSHGPAVNHIVLSKLYFPVLQISQEGVYRCSAGNTSVDFRIAVQVKAQLQNIAGSRTVNGTVNNTVTITCVADGHPRPTISWFKDGEELRNITKYFPSNDISKGFRMSNYPGIMQVASNLIIRDLQIADSGAYMCQANSSGTPGDSLSYQLTVIPPPPPEPCDNVNCNHGTCTNNGRHANCTCNNRYDGVRCDIPPTNEGQINLEPEITTHPNPTSARLFQGANMTCRAIGYPAPDINWFRDDEILTKFKNRQQIIFDQVDLEDRGFYHCEANNSVGKKISSRALLNISDIIQYRAVVDTSSSARRRRQSSIDNAMLDGVIERINMVLSGVEYRGARFFSAVRATDSSSIIMTFTLASVDTQELKTFVNDQLAANNVIVNTTGNNTAPITAFSRFDGCPVNTTIIRPHQSSNFSMNISINWPESNLGENVTVDCPCGNLTLGSDSLVAHHFCGGNFRTGGRWINLIDTKCNASDISRKICELANEPPTQRLDGLNEIFASNDTSSMIMDFEVTASVSLLVDTTSQAIGNQTLSMSYLRVVDSIVQLEPVLLAQTQESANTSSRLLEGIMNLAENLPIPENSTRVTIPETTFVVSVQRVDPSTVPAKGLSFGAALGGFSPDGKIDPSSLIFNRTENTPVTASVLLPLNILNRTNNTRVAFSLFLTDSLFLRRMNEEQQQETIVGSVILSASIVGERLRNINPRVELVFKINNDSNGTSPNCNFWNQTLDMSYGNWSDYGCETVYNMSDPDAGVTCRCNHLTSFAILLDVAPTNSSNTDFDKALGAITNVGISISIVCLLITMATYLSIKKLRTKDQGQLLLLLCFALLGLYVTFILAGLEFIIHVDGVCIAFSSLIQYFMLVTFMSMLAESVNLYMKLVVVLGSQINYYVIKAYIVVWLIPIFIVLLTLIPGIKDYHNDKFCIPRQIPFYIGTIVPVIVIYLFNCVLFVIIFASLIKKSRQSNNKNDESGGNKNYKLVKQQFIAALSLAVLFGLGWGFGFLSTGAFDDVKPFRRTMEIIFIFLTSFQGLFVFLFQCVYSKAVRDIWVGWFSRVVLKRAVTRRTSNFTSTTSKAKKSETLLSNQQGSNARNSYTEKRGSNSSNSCIEMDSKDQSGSPEKSPESFQETSCN